jgi:hypothetical protein
MSEYQYVGFRAIDAPVSGKDLEFMRRQSTRAEVTPRSFDNEYHYGSFRGDAEAMLRRGYDFHLRYANFGVRTLMIRLPAGLSNAAVAKPYFEKDSLYILRDPKGLGGILVVNPYHEAGDLEELWDPSDMLDRLLPLREEIMNGDLRPLYLASLSVRSDINHNPSEEREGPVPAGLEKLTAAQDAFAEFYELSPKLIATAARESPPLPKPTDPPKMYAAWLAKQSAAAKSAWLAQLMADSQGVVRREILAKFREDNGDSAWPTAKPSRTIAELFAAGLDKRRR